MDEFDKDLSMLTAQPIQMPPDRQMPQDMQNMTIGMAYVPYQKWEKPYDAEIGFDRGTLFPALDKPFLGEAGVSRG